MSESMTVIPAKIIEEKILLIRGQKVMLDSDLAALYGVETFNLNKAVKRNRERFPVDFMFQLSREEYTARRFQFGILEMGKHSQLFSTRSANWRVRRSRLGKGLDFR
jgi:hypothetical protein